MKKVIYILLLVVSTNLSAQQISLNSQYLFNDMIVNPGAIGIIENYVPVQLNMRKQWSNFPGAPITQSASCQSSVYKKMGIGGTVFNDAAGPSRRTGLNFSTAYHLRLDSKKNHTLGLGIGISMTQHLIDVNKLNTYLPDDPAVLRGFNNQFVPDANTGIFYHFKEKGFFGISAYNLVQTNRNLFDLNKNLINTLNRTYYIYGGYTLEVSEQFSLKATTLSQTIETGTTQIDLSLIGTFNKMAWLGASYRNKDAIAILAGCQIKGLRVGYSYDVTLSDIKKYSYGSHEFFVELQIFKNGSKGKNPWSKKGKNKSSRFGNGRHG